MVDIVDIVDQLPIARRPAPAPLSRFRQVTVHRTDGKNSTPQTTSKFHTDPPPKGRGWRTIGYHLYMMRTGFVYQTLRYEWVGIHAPHQKGADTYSNIERLGVVLVGLCDEPITDDQRIILPQLLVQLCTQFDISTKEVYGHREVNPGHTDCPGDSLLSLVAGFRADPQSLIAQPREDTETL